MLWHYWGLTNIVSPQPWFVSHETVKSLKLTLVHPTISDKVFIHLSFHYPFLEPNELIV